MKKMICKTNIRKEKGYLYYVAEDRDGNLCIFQTKCGRKKEINNDINELRKQNDINRFRYPKLSLEKLYPWRKR
jgi:hypothetical protein